MDAKQLDKLVLYIVSRVEELGGYTTTIRLVKFLYLIDLEHQRRLDCTLTDLEWVYHLYGPYAFEVPEIGARLGFDLQREEFVSSRGHQGTLLHVAEPQDFPSGLSYGVEVPVNGLLGVWADVGTSELLQYVYRTEPMRRAQQGDRLDFSVMPPGTRYYKLHIPIQERIARQLRKSLQSYARESVREFVRPITVCDDALAAGLSALEDEEESLLRMVDVKPKVDVDALHSTLLFED